jgi:hypothetical protein
MRGGVCVHFALGALLAIGIALGCGGGGDNTADAGPPDAAETLCPVPQGHSRVLSHVRFLPADQGFDLDGDEVIDNEVGKMPDSARDSVHEGMDEALTVGELMMIFHIEDWTEPPTPTDEDIRFHVFSGLDADVPIDPSKKFSGEGKFYVRVGEFDLNCDSTTEADEATIIERKLVATRSAWSFAITVGAGTMEFRDPRIEQEFDADYYGANGMFGGKATICSLSALAFPGETPGTVLDAFVNDPIFADAISVDMDIDGDGLEEVVGDGVTILECIDGDGVTVIEGRDCPCHPAMADAYSLAMYLETVPAEIVAVR